MTPESVQPSDQSPAGMGEFSRITGVLFEPKKTFEDIGRRPRWLVPLLLVILSSIGFYYLVGQRVGWERLARQQMESSRMMQERMSSLSEAQRQQALSQQARFMGIGYYAGTAVAIPLMFALSAAVMWGIASGLMSAGLRFKQVYAVACYAAIPTVLKMILSAVVLFLKKPDDFNVTNPLAFNPAAFMDPLTSSKFLYTIAMSLDLFVIWGLLLTATGLSAAAGKRLSFGGGLVASVVPFAALVLLGASLAGMFG